MSEAPTTQPDSASATQDAAPAPTHGTTQLHSATALDANVQGVTAGGNTPSPDAAGNAELQPSTEAQGATKPEGLPDKFWDSTTGTVRVDALVKSHNYLEGRAGKPPEPQATPETTPAETAQPAPAGADWAAMAEEYSARGELSQPTLDALNQMGIPENVVSNYVAGLQAQAAQFETQVESVVGGADNWTSVKQWAQQNLAAEEQTAFDNVLSGGSDAEALLAIRGLHARWGASTGGQGPQLVTASGSAGSASGTAGFTSQSDMTAAMADPRYGRDKAYTEEVAGRTARSSFF